jgi:CHASE3 domain sensor protein
MAKKTESEKAKEILGFLEEKEQPVPVSETQKKQLDMAVNLLVIVVTVGAILLLIAVILIFISKFEIVSPV